MHKRKKNKSNAPPEAPSLEIFDNFEEENDAVARLNAGLSPEEHFIMAHQIIKSLYHIDDGKRDFESIRTITFKIINGVPV
jgi:hypothetical protein